jgi:hypothetical protein
MCYFTPSQFMIVSLKLADGMRSLVRRCEEAIRNDVKFNLICDTID